MEIKNFSISLVVKRALKHLTGGQIALIGFAFIAFCGMLILMLPISNVYHTWTNPVDALFTSISAVCVTGLITLPTGTYWNLFGQIVILLLIQVGGLGFMTFMTMFFVSVGRRITIHDRLLIQSAINSDHLSGIVDFATSILGYALAIEGAGALLLAVAFIPDFGFLRGAYFAVWHSVSMYCNAGFDLMASVGENSFTAYVNNTWVSLTISLLIIVGGLGFSVYVDLLDYSKKRKLSMHTKAVLITTGILLFGGALLFYFFECHNPLTLEPLPWYGKLNAAFFQATTPRTAGANTIDQSAMTSSSVFLTDILMFIGASPGSTGGGIKTTTVFVILLTIWSMLMGHKDVNVMRRRITLEVIIRALAIFMIGLLAIGFVLFLLVNLEPELEPQALLFEVLSAYGTVGLSFGITSSLSVWSKLILIVCMFIGRVGPLTIAYVLTNTEKRMHENQGHYTLPPGNLIVG